MHTIINAGLSPLPHKTEHHFEHHDDHRHVSYHFNVEPAHNVVDLDRMEGVERILCTDSALRISFASDEQAERARWPTTHSSAAASSGAAYISTTTWAVRGPARSW